MVNNLPALPEKQEDPLEKGTTTHSSILAWKIPWTEEPSRLLYWEPVARVASGLQSIGSQRVRHDWSNWAHTHTHRTKKILNYETELCVGPELVAVMHPVIYPCACIVSNFNSAWLFVTLWTVACQAPLPMGLSKQEYWNGLPCLPSGESSQPNDRTRVSYISCIGKQVLCY